MTKEDFALLVEDELDSLQDFVMNEAQQDYEVNGFLESFSQRSAAACSNVFQAVPEEGEDGMGVTLLITAVYESWGTCGTLYIVSVVDNEEIEAERKLCESWDDVIKFAVKKWYNIHYNADKEYEWRYKDGKYEEDVVED